MNPRRLLTATILVGLALSGTACGAEPPPTAELEATDTPAPEPVTITFWYSVGGENGELLVSMIDEFNETNAYGITVDHTYSGGYGETAQKVIASLASDTLPDGGLVPAAPLWTGREGNYKIAEFMEGPNGLDADDFWPVLWDYNEYDGEVCSLPFNNSTMVLYYNKDLMQEAGLDAEKPPETWDELESMAKQIVDNVPDSFGVDVKSADWMLKALILQNGGRIMNEDATDPAFDSPAGYEAMSWWQKLIDEGLMLPAQHDGARDRFMSGRLGFFYDSTGSLGKVRSGAQFEWNTAFMPKREQYGATVGGAALALFPSSPEREQATWRFLKWLLSPENCIKWTVETGYVPVRESILESPEIQQLFEEFPESRAGFEQLEYARTYPHFWEMGTLDDLLAQAIEKMELGTAGPQEALDEAASLLREEME
ncbi:MAG: ABC transporter substrate-binding protein [bacterium]